MKVNPAWIAVDWGTSNFRAWALDKNDKVIDSRYSDKGVGVITQDQFEPVLLNEIGDWLDENRVINIIACGMVGSKQGWIETPYRKIPCSLPKIQIFGNSVQINNKYKFHIIPGLKQLNPPDVIRGEETKLLGVMEKSNLSTFQVCLPGTHGKWIRISNGVIQYFNSFMTGELFSILGKYSILKHTVDSGWCEEGFAEGIQLLKENPIGFASHIFSIRADAILNSKNPSYSNARLSGYLIGSEVSSMLDKIADSPVIVAGTNKLNCLYTKALSHFGISAISMNGEEMVLEGLRKSYEYIIQSK